MISVLPRFSVSHLWRVVLPVVVMVCAAVAFSLKLQRQEEREAGQRIRARAAGVEEQLKLGLMARLDSLLYLGHRWERGGPPTREEWEADAQLYLGHAPDLQALEWVDPSLHVRWVVPLAGNEAILNQPSAPEARRQQALETARAQREPVFTQALDLRQGGRGFLVYVPLYRGETFEGFLVGAFRAEKVFNTVLPNWSTRYAVSVFSSGTFLYQHGQAAEAPRALVQEREFEMYGVNWQVKLAPAAGDASVLPSRLPQLLLGCGVLVAMLVGGLAHFALTAQRRSQELDAANRALQGDITERQRLIGELQKALAEVKTLQGIIPICSGCKKIRDDKGFWNQVEAYFTKHSGARFSHGLCPECVSKYYPDQTGQG